MATAASIRDRVRTRLEETTAAVWTDVELDECVTGALEAYGSLFPVDVIATATVLDGATSAPEPTATLGIRRVLLANGALIPRRRAPDRATSDEELAWEHYAGQLHFTRQLSAQTLTIWHSAAPALDDVPPNDEGLLVLGAVSQALQARAIQDYKRGGQLSLARGDSVIIHARDTYDRALNRRMRRVRDGMVAAD